MSVQAYMSKQRIKKEKNEAQILKVMLLLILTIPRKNRKKTTVSTIEIRSKHF